MATNLASAGSVEADADADAMLVSDVEVIAKKIPPPVKSRGVRRARAVGAVGTPDLSGSAPLTTAPEPPTQSSGGDGGGVGAAPSSTTAPPPVKSRGGKSRADLPAPEAAAVTALAPSVWTMSDGAGAADAPADADADADLDLGPALAPSDAATPPPVAAPGRSRLLSQHGWLGSAHMESPCCLR
jgi:hypothetical protein